MRFAVGVLFRLLVWRQKGVGLVSGRNDIRPRPHTEVWLYAPLVALTIGFHIGNFPAFRADGILPTLSRDKNLLCRLVLM